jgi:hypothetical protein
MRLNRGKNRSDERSKIMQVDCHNRSFTLDDFKIICRRWSIAMASADQFVQVDGLKTRLTESGNGPAVTLWEARPLPLPRRLSR